MDNSDDQDVMEQDDTDLPSDDETPVVEETSLAGEERFNGNYVQKDR